MLLYLVFSSHSTVHRHVAVGTIFASYFFPVIWRLGWEVFSTHSIARDFHDRFPKSFWHENLSAWGFMGFFVV